MTLARLHTPHSNTARSWSAVVLYRFTTGAREWAKAGGFIAGVW